MKLQKKYGFFHFLSNFLHMGGGLSLTVLFLAVLFLGPSCGKKGPPIPPVIEGNVLAAPDNLAASLEENRLTLTWTHTIDPKTAKIAPEAFEVHMATKDAAACEGCPFVFKSMGVVSMPDMVYHGSLVPGFHYYFRVQAIGRDEMKSGYTKTTYVDFTK
jgi:hypothetical protein